MKVLMEGFVLKQERKVLKGWLSPEHVLGHMSQTGFVGVSG